MKGLRHPNIVLLMGAVTEPPNLSIVTEYLSRYQELLQCLFLVFPYWGHKKWKALLDNQCYMSVNRIHDLDCRGSLYKLLHIPDARVVVDERLRLNMAYDVVCMLDLLSLIFLIKCWVTFCMVNFQHKYQLPHWSSICTFHWI